MKVNRLLFFVFLLCIFLTACTVAPNDNLKNQDGDVSLFVEAINYDDVPWNESIGDFTHDLFITPELALKLAALYLAEVNLIITEDKNVSVQKVKESDIYVITYLPNPLQLGGDINVALHSKTGEVLKMWSGE